MLASSTPVMGDRHAQRDADILRVVEADLVGDVDDPVGRIAQHVDLNPVIAVHMRDA